MGDAYEYDYTLYDDGFYEDYDPEYDQDDAYGNDDLVDPDNFVQDEFFFEDAYLPQFAGWMPLLLVLVGTLVVIVFAVNVLGDFIPGSITPVTQTIGSSRLEDSPISPIFTPEVQFWSASIQEWSEQTGIDANLIATVMQIESCGDPFATSSVGAMGLFQVMPFHFESGEDPYQPATNARQGLDYLSRALEARDGVIRLGFAGYNGGITGAKRPESDWASETQRYVYWGSGIYQDAVNGEISSDRLEEWLNRGGQSLCRQAAQQLGITP